MAYLVKHGEAVKGSIVILGAPGLRSVGKIAIDYLIEKLKPTLVAELYSPHFPAIHQTEPSYAPHPDYPGDAGVLLQKNGLELPKVDFYFSASLKLLLTNGYHANFWGQYDVAKRVLDFYQEYGVKRMFILAGHGIGNKDVCCAATKLELVKAMKQYGIETEYEGPFMGFSGLVFGLGKLRGIDGICLFGRTQPRSDDPEYPDPRAARNVLEKLSQLLNFELDLSKLDAKP
ncbi:MAG: PAC2 family protein [Candidatus Bathyarchaeota archaeon]